MNPRVIKTLVKYYRSLPPRPKGQFLLTCAFAHRGDILSFGFNKYKTHPLTQNYPKKYKKQGNRCLCAEMDALKNFRKDKNSIDFSKISVYVYRQTRQNLPACAVPCPGCYAALEALGVGAIYASTASNAWEKVYPRGVIEAGEMLDFS